MEKEFQLEQKNFNRYVLKSRILPQRTCCYKKEHKACKGVECYTERGWLKGNDHTQLEKCETLITEKQSQMDAMEEKMGKDRQKLEEYFYEVLSLK